MKMINLRYIAICKREKILKVSSKQSIINGAACVVCEPGLNLVVIMLPH